MSRSLVPHLVAVAALATLSACGGPPPPPPPTVVNATVTAAAESNGGAPVSLRLYQLVSPASFEGAQFFPLFNNDAAALGDDLVKRDDLLLAPAQSRTLVLSPPDRAKAIGVFAAFRDYEGKTWRAVAAISPHQTSAMTVVAGAGGVEIKSEPAAKP